MAYLSPSEVAQLLRTSQKWLYQQLNKGNIPGAFRIGGIWLVDKEVLVETLKRKAQTPKATKPGGNKSRHGL